MEMQESITVCTQIPTDITQDDSSSFPIVMVITHRLKKTGMVQPKVKPSFKRGDKVYLQVLNTTRYF